MKKKNLKSLSLNKKSISNLTSQSKVTGGQGGSRTMVGGPCPVDSNIFDTCGVCDTDVTCESAICPSWWGGQLCQEE